MELCSKCHQNEATVHLTCVMGGLEEKVHLCKDCAPATGFEGLSLEEIKAFSIIGKKCDFCGEDATSGVGSPRSTSTYLCRDCGWEWSRISQELLTSEHPEMIQRMAGARSFLSTSFDPEFTAVANDTSQKATRLLKERRRQDGRDKNGESNN
jgi:transposase-like protein